MLGADDQFAFPGQIEQSLNFMRYLRHGRKIEKSRQPFDRVKPAKNRIQRLGVARVLIERKQAHLDIAEMLARLHHKIAQQLWIVPISSSSAAEKSFASASISMLVSLKPP